jgi:hypothetical protein
MVRTILASLVTTASAHGVMYEPPVRQSGGMNMLLPACAGGSCLWFNQGTTIGCPKATGGGTVFPDVPGCKDHAQPTIAFKDKELRTYALSDIYRLEDYTKHHPWRYPGSAPVEDPCGLAGGWYKKGHAGNGGEAPPGAPQGEHGSSSKLFPKLLERTTWVAGSVVEVAWGITANHGGGYQYRLCPASSALTEECFQQQPLAFVGDVQWIQQGHGMDVTDRTEIPATRVGGDKVVPAGSTWTRNPIPPCNTPIDGGALHSPCLGPTFKPPIEGGVGEAYGFGGGMCQSGLPFSKCSPKQFKKQNFDFGIVDKVQVPALPEGDYVLSFRWESEQTPQVWSSCGDVTIKAAGPGTKPFSPTRGCTSCCVEGAICANCTGCVNNKSGDCAYCWEPLKGYAPGAPDVTCLGHETADGHAPNWQPGDSTSTGWSPGCTSCWAESECKSFEREFLTDVLTV